MTFDFASYLPSLDPTSLTGALELAVIYFLIGQVAALIIGRMFRFLVRHDTEGRVDRMTATFLKRIVQVLLWVFILTLYTKTIPALDKLGTALLASVSIASVVIGLAAQNTLSNLIAGISLVIYRPFRLGDRIQINAPTGLETGIVEDVTLGYTRLKTYDNRRIVLSNSLVSNQIMVNLTSVEPRVMALVPISIGYESDIDRARAIVLDVAAQHPSAEEVVGCPVTLLNASSVDMTLRVWCKDAGEAAGFRNDMLESVKKRFDKEGIEIPFAYQNVVLKGGSDQSPEKDKDRQDQ
ncbi:mechanosensitive ion channel family protein [Mesobacterium sp. TK19101]|uniref:Small-conductance mechanosensitive channel n=1 Tax=Mesobacterium hydrothermale TaxID=3111907 RepID=A0ABU6HLW5_9RHOB|nr:mechanosensitive ion channel family protein [Mesobacterium sp. TK19101]MEC3863097.1 mechanosensitive ion channel family protein [Mesobacterium sp. TK19101]